MSLIQPDKEVADERSAPLKDVDAPLRDQIVDKLFTKLEDLDIGVKVEEMWNRGNADRESWLRRQREYLQSWDEHLIADTSGPFQGSSQLHIPMPLIVCKTFHARMYQAIMGIDPPLFVKARNEASIERVQTVSDTMRYYLQDGANHGKGIEEVVDRWIWDWCTTGLGLMKWRWDVTYSRYVDVKEVIEMGEPLYQPGPNGEIIKIPQPKKVEKEVDVVRKCFDGPVCDLVDAEDLVIIGGQGDPDVAEAVLHREFLTASRLWTLADRKIFKKEAVADIIKHGEDKQSGAGAADMKQQRAANAGLTAVDSEDQIQRYEICEAHLKIDVDGSGIAADIIAWVHLGTRRLLRATYLYRVSPSGDRPFSKAVFQPRKGQQYPVGLVEMLYPLSREMDAIHNMRLDMGLVATMPFGFYRASSGIDPETIQLEPGALIPVDNPMTDVMFPNLGNRTVFGFQEEAAIQTMVERLTSISDMNLGVIGGQGATRTATGARALVGEMSSNLDVYLRRLNRGWKKHLRTLLHMLQQRIPDGMGFRLTGDDGKDYWHFIKNAKDLEGDYDIEVLPNSASSNQSIQVDTAQQVLQMTSNPLDIQLGLVGPGERYEALKNYYQALGVKDWGRFVVKMDPNARLAKLSPEEEANRILRGMETPVAPGMDHEGFIAYWEEIKKHDDWLGQFDENQSMLMEAQARKHAQMAQAMAAMQAQQANAQQMQTNAAMSQQQAPVGMSPTQGAAPNAPAAG